MKNALFKTLIGASLIGLSSISSASAFASAAKDASKEIIPLVGGETLYIFRDGKMAKEDRFGRAKFAKVGSTVEAISGKRILLTSNEVARLDRLLRENYLN